MTEPLRHSRGGSDLDLLRCQVGALSELVYVLIKNIE